MKLIAVLLLLGTGSCSGIHAQQTVPPRYSYSAHARQFLLSTFGPRTLLASTASASMRASFNASPGWGYDFHRYENHLEGYLARRSIQQSIEYGVGALIRQDEGFTTSHLRGFHRRINSALYRSLFVTGPHGNEFAYPRLAASVGTAIITDQWHPWRDRGTSPWVGASSILATYVARSIWQEFKPDIVFKARHWLRLN